MARTAFQKANFNRPKVNSHPEIQSTPVELCCSILIFSIRYWIFYIHSARITPMTHSATR